MVYFREKYHLWRHLCRGGAGCHVTGLRHPPTDHGVILKILLFELNEGGRGLLPLCHHSVGDAGGHVRFVEGVSFDGDLLKGCVAGYDSCPSVDEVWRGEDGGGPVAVARLQKCCRAIDIDEHVLGSLLDDSVAVEDSRKVPICDFALLLVGGDPIGGWWGREHNLSWLRGQAIAADNGESLSRGAARCM